MYRTDLLLGIMTKEIKKPVTHKGEKKNDRNIIHCGKSETPNYQSKNQ